MKLKEQGQKTLYCRNQLGLLFFINWFTDFFIENLGTEDEIKILGTEDEIKIQNFHLRFYTNAIQHFII